MPIWGAVMPIPGAARSVSSRSTVRVRRALSNSITGAQICFKRWSGKKIIGCTVICNLCVGRYVLDGTASRYGSLLSQMSKQANKVLLIVWKHFVEFNNVLGLAHWGICCHSSGMRTIKVLIPMRLSVFGGYIS